MFGLMVGMSKRSGDSTLPDDLLNFPSGGIVVDIGCGPGHQLRELENRGCRAVGIDPDHARVSSATNILRIAVGKGEKLPIKSQSADGVLCKVVLPYTDEAQVVGEISRVLKAGGTGRLCSHGAGYYLQYLFQGESWKFRVYALRTFVNTWLYGATGLRMPGFLGDTIYQSVHRLRKYYELGRLKVMDETNLGTFWGSAVFIYHSVKKLD